MLAWLISYGFTWATCRTDFATLNVDKVALIPQSPYVGLGLYNETLQQEGGFFPGAIQPHDVHTDLEISDWNLPLDDCLSHERHQILQRMTMTQ